MRDRGRKAAVDYAAGLRDAWIRLGIPCALLLDLVGHLGWISRWRFVMRGRA